MKTFRNLLLFLVAGLALPADSAFAKKKHSSSPSAPTPEPAPDVSQVPEPARGLAPYILYLDQLLALQRTGGGAVVEQAPGRLVLLRQELAGKLGASTEAERASLNAAITTCDALTAALNERQKTLGNVQTSASVTGSGAISQAARKDNLQEGLHGGDYAKAVGSKVELARERDQNKQSNSTTAATHGALSAMAVNGWNARAAQLRQIITADYAAITAPSETEKTPPPAPAPIPAAPSAAATAPAPSSSPAKEAEAEADSAGANQQALEERLRDSHWKVGDERRTFTLLPDGKTKASWHKHGGVWKVTGPHTAEVEIDVKKTLRTFTFDDEAKTATITPSLSGAEREIATRTR